MDPTSSLVYIVLVAILTGTITWLFFRPKVDGLTKQLVASNAELSKTRKELEGSAERNSDLQNQLVVAKTEQTALAERLAAERESFERERTTERESFERERAAFEKAKETLVDTFRSVGAEVLDSNSAKIAELAKGVLAAENAETSAALELKEQSIANMVGPVKEQLEKLSAVVGEIERKREGAYSDVKGRIEALLRTESELQRETTNLSVNTATLMQALKGSGTRGRWGEFTLQRVVEMAGMTERCEYDVQPTLIDEDGSSRPDMIVHMPADSFVAIDAKAPMAAYIASMEAGDDVTRNLKIKEHARSVRAHIDELSKRSYVRPDLGSPDFMIMFVPGEGILSAAFNEDPDLLEYAYTRKILFATPINLIAMLRTIALSWQHNALEADAAEIAREGGELYERLAKTGKYLAEMGSSLNRTVANYNDLVGNLEGRVMISGRRLRERAITVRRNGEIPQIKPLEAIARPLNAPEFVDQPEEVLADPPEVRHDELPVLALTSENTNGATYSNGSNGSNGVHNGSNGSNGVHNATNGSSYAEGNGSNGSAVYNAPSDAANVTSNGHLSGSDGSSDVPDVQTYVGPGSNGASHPSVPRSPVGGSNGANGSIGQMNPNSRTMPSRGSTLAVSALLNVLGVFRK